MAREITILGAGLVGSLLAIMLRQRGYEVTIYDRRPDMRDAQVAGGRSINLTISTRGWKALEMAGLKDEIESISIPLYGRCVHQEEDKITIQPYSKNHDAIYCVSRGELNKKLVNLAEMYGAKINFGYCCTGVDVEHNIVHFELPDGSRKTIQAGLLFGADGASSALRQSYLGMEGVKGDSKYMNYGYKELNIPAAASGEWPIEKNMLHIWPRKNAVLLAMANTDGTFTCTFVMPFEGKQSFSSLGVDEEVNAYFEEKFPDAKTMMPELAKEFFANPTSCFVTRHISKWHHKGKSALIGDAAHAIVPFYGQGMNAGFEDCSVLCELLDSAVPDGNMSEQHWEKVLSIYELLRKPNGNAVASLALHNFAEIREKIADTSFLDRKKIEIEIARRFPSRFVPIYEMVSFTDIPYNTAMQCINEQNKLLQRIMNEGDFFLNIQNTAFTSNLEKWVNEYNRTLQQFSYRHAA